MLLLLVLLVVNSSPAPAAGQAVPVVNPISSICNSTTAEPRNYLPNSTFQANLANLAAVLQANASASGFSAGAFGTAPDTAYGLALCRGDFNGKDCAACLATAFQDAQYLCGRSKDVTIYHDQCQIRFSDQDFFPGTDNAPETVAWNMNNVSAVDAAAFDGLVARLVNAVADAASKVSKKYATGSAGFPQGSMDVYGLAQCTPDLTADQCRRCLAGVIGEMPKWFSGRVGGRILGVRCNLRYEKDLFFATGADTLQVTPLVNSSKECRLANILAVLLLIRRPVHMGPEPMTPAGNESRPATCIDSITIV